MTHSYVCHDSFICVSWLSYTCMMTHSYVWHDFVMRDDSIMCVMTYADLWVHDWHSTDKVLGEQILNTLCQQNSSKSNHYSTSDSQQITCKAANLCIWHMSSLAHCNTLQHTATHCNALQHTATHCNALQRTATHCNTLQPTATHCNTLQHTATHCSTLQHTAAHCNTLQHTATHCNTLQHTATHNNCGNR